MAPSHSLSHLSDSVLLSDLTSLVTRERTNSAALLAYLAEFDARKLYLPAGYPSLYVYCLRELHMSEDSACKRIRAARAARQFPSLFTAIAEGRLHLSAVVMLAPYLTIENAEQLIGAATDRQKSEVEQLLAERFPRPDVPTRLMSLAPTPSLDMPAVSSSSEASVSTTASPEPARRSPGADRSAPGRIEAADPRPRVIPLAPERFALQLTIDKATRDNLRYAQELLSHQVFSRDVAQVIGRALLALIRELEKTKFAATEQPRGGSSAPAAGSRHIPAQVRRAVWERDGGQCTFVGNTGRRCPSRSLLEFDHVLEVARGGEATENSIRLRCRAHNQYGAERTFGSEFMEGKRREAFRQREGTRASSVQ